MKYFYIAVAVEQDRNDEIFTDRNTNDTPSLGYYAYMLKVSPSQNIAATLGVIGGLLHANIMPTRKQAAETVTRWNATYKANGTYLFDTPAF